MDASQEDRVNRSELPVVETPIYSAKTQEKLAYLPTCGSAAPRALPAEKIYAGGNLSVCGWLFQAALTF
jgi:hypothetical protein